MKEKRRGEIKNLAKMAKNRLKSGFWENYKATMEENLINAEKDGVACSAVIRYYKAEVTKTVAGNKNRADEIFYAKVKEVLDLFGECSDILGRLCDEEYMKSLSFQQKQRYLFDLAARYRVCRERYFKEKQFALAGNNPRKIVIQTAAGFNSSPASVAATVL